MATSPVRTARLERLIDVAQAEFLARGYRGTTMEGIAEAGGLSKVTLYGYFRDKEAAFDAVLDRFADRLETETLAALDRPGSLRERVLAALVTKHGIVADVVRRSAYAAELMTARHGASGRIAELDTRLVGRLADATGDPHLARILFACARTLANEAADREQMVQDISRVVAALVKE